MLPLGFFVIHNSTRSCQDNVAKLTRWKQIVSPLLNGIDGYIKTWRDDTTLNETTSEVYYNLASPMVINNLKFSNVTMPHHHRQKFDYDL